MELQQIRYVLALCETRSFTRAAERCAVSQPALTTAVRRLEEELEGALFHRDRGGAKLTSFGELLLPRFQRLADEIQSIGAIAKDNRLLRGVPLRVGVLKTIGPSRLSDYLERFRRCAPAVELEIKVLRWPELLTGLEGADVDVAIATVPDAKPPWLVLRTLHAERYMVTLPPMHRLEGKPAVSLADLSGEPYVDRLACEMRDTIRRACADQHVSLYATYRTEDEGWIECLVRAGIGFAFLPEYSILSDATLRRPLIEPAVTRNVALLRCAERAMSPAARILWEVFSTVAEESLP